MLYIRISQPRCYTPLPRQGILEARYFLTDHTSTTSNSTYALPVCKLFITYLSLLSTMSIEDQQLYWIQFPSKVESGEWNCLDGTTGRIQSLLQKITAKYPQRQYESVEKRSYRGKIE